MDEGDKELVKLRDCKVPPVALVEVLLDQRLHIEIFETCFCTQGFCFSQLGYF